MDPKGIWRRFRSDVMTHREKVNYLLADLPHRGVNPYTAAPPAWRLAWWLGLKLPPPHFLGFGPLVLLLALGMAPFFGGPMWVVLERPAGGWVGLTVASAAMGVVFGLTMGWYYRREAGRLELPPWEKYPRG